MPAAAPSPSPLNLKQVAARLGVHYQTAYRWVRSGELHAVKIEGQYRVTHAAIERFVAARAAPIERVDEAAELSVPDPTESTGIQELIATVVETRGTARPSLQTATRVAATALGDMSVIRLLADDGVHTEFAAAHSVDPALFAAISALGHGVDLGAAEWWRDLFDTGRPVRQNHMDQHRFDAGLGADGRLLAGRYRAYSLAVEPIWRDEQLHGGIFISRATPGRPYSEDDFALLESIAEQCSSAFDRELAFRDAWDRDSALTTHIEALMATSSVLTPADVGPLLLDGEPEAVFDAGGALVAASDSAAVLARTNARLDDDGVAALRTELQPQVDRIAAGTETQLGEPLNGGVTDGPTVGFVSAVRSPAGDLRATVVVARGRDRH